jgi:vitamin B12 transporter
MTFGRVNNYATFMQSIFNYKDRLIITGGVRHDINSQFKDSTTYKVESAYRIEKTGPRIRGAYATAFRAPTFNDLFFPPFDFQLGFGLQPTSNPDLKPEKTKSWEVGFDQSFLDGIVKIESTYFDSKITDLIQFDATRDFLTDPLAFIPFNLSNATLRGTESYVKVKFDNSSITLAHTWNEALDEDNNQLIRRARHKFSANLHHSWKKLKATIGVNFKTGINEGGGRTTDDYKTVRAVLEYQLLKNLVVTARAENLFDENYQESVGFGTPRLTGYLGFVLSSD